MSTYLTPFGYQWVCDDCGLEMFGTAEAVKAKRAEHERTAHAEPVWEMSPEHDGLQGILITDRNEQGTLL